MSHTPGPWVAKQEMANRWRIEVPREGFVPVSVGIACTTVLEVGVSNEHTEANARLIAAAPELLEALILAEAVMTRNIYPKPDQPDGDWAKLLVVRAAIAKAQGEA